MSNMYPGERNPRPHFNEFIYRRTAELLSIGSSSLVFDPESAVAQAIRARAQAMVERGIDPYQVAVVASKAQIDHSVATYLPRNAALEGISDH